MSRLADTLFEDVSSAVSQGISGRTLRSALPTDFADLAFDLAIRSVDTTGRARAPELEGSGTQQFMFLHLLDLADRTARGAGLAGSKDTYGRSRSQNHSYTAGFASATRPTCSRTAGTNVGRCSSLLTRTSSHELAPARSSPSHCR